MAIAGQIHFFNMRTRVTAICVHLMHIVQGACAYATRYIFALALELLKSGTVSEITKNNFFICDFWGLGEEGEFIFLWDCCR